MTAPFIFNPLASAGFISTEWIPNDDEDYRILIAGLNLSSWEYEGNTNIKLLVRGRAVSNDAAVNNKRLNQEIQLGRLDMESGELTPDDDGWRKVKQIFNAAFGYENSEEGDARFAEEREGIDLTMNLKELKLTGSGWDLLVGCEYEATTKVKDRKDSDKKNIYFNYIRKVS